MDIQVGALLGVVGGMVTGLAGWYFGRKNAQKERGLDEVHQFIWQKARSYSWYATLGAIYVLMFLAIFGFPLSVIGVLSILMIVHLFSWGMIGAMLSLNIYNESKADKQIYIFLLGYFVLLGIIFVILAFFLK